MVVDINSGSPPAKQIVAPTPKQKAAVQVALTAAKQTVQQLEIAANTMNGEEFDVAIEVAESQAELVIFTMRKVRPELSNKPVYRTQ